MSSKDTIEKAYGGIPKEVTGILDTSWIPTYRNLQYYWYTLVRYFSR